MVSSIFLSLFSVIPCILAVQVHPVARSAISSDAQCMDVYQWMNDAQGDSPCLTVAYVEAACIGSTYNQAALMVGNSYSRPNSTTANACYCSWSSYNLLMACTLCQGPNFSSSLWTWPAWASGCTASSSWTNKYFPSGYELSGNASIPYWATLDPAKWSGELFNVQEANATHHQNPSYVVPGASSTSTLNPSSSGSSSKSTNAGAIVGGTIGGAAALALLAVGAYLVYRRHVYKKGAYASVVNQQGMGFIDRSNGATTSMTHNRFPSDTFTYLAPGNPVSPSQQYTMYSPQPQTVYPSLQGSFSPPPGPDTSIYTTRAGQPSTVIPLV